MAKYWNKMSDEAIQKYEAEMNNPDDPTDDELTDINVETVNSIMKYLLASPVPGVQLMSG